MMLLVLYGKMVSRPWKKSESAKCLINHRHISQLQCQPPRLLAENSRKYVCLRRKKKWILIVFSVKPSHYCFSFHSTLLFSLWVLRDFFWNPTPLFHFMKWFLTILFDDVIKPNWFILLFKSIILLCTWKCNFSVYLLNY